MTRARMVAVNSKLVNWLPWSVLKIWGRDILEDAGLETPDISIPNSVREFVGDFQYGETE